MRASIINNAYEHCGRRQAPRCCVGIMLKIVLCAFGDEATGMTFRIPSQHLERADVILRYQ